MGQERGKGESGGKRKCAGDCGKKEAEEKRGESLREIAGGKRKRRERVGRKKIGD